MLATDIGPEEFEDRPSDPKDAAGMGYALGIGRLSQMPMPLVTVSLLVARGGIEPPTRGFSERSLTLLGYIFQQVTDASVV